MNTSNPSAVGSLLLSNDSDYCFIDATSAGNPISSPPALVSVDSYTSENKEVEVMEERSSVVSEISMIDFSSDVNRKSPVVSIIVDQYSGPEDNGQYSGPEDNEEVNNILLEDLHIRDIADDTFLTLEHYGRNSSFIADPKSIFYMNDSELVSYFREMGMDADTVQDLQFVLRQTSPAIRQNCLLLTDAKIERLSPSQKEFLCQADAHPGMSFGDILELSAVFRLPEQSAEALESYDNDPKFTGWQNQVKFWIKHELRFLPRQETREAVAELLSIIDMVNEIHTAVELRRGYIAVIALMVLKPKDKGILIQLLGGANNIDKDIVVFLSILSILRSLLSESKFVDVIVPLHDHAVALYDSSHALLNEFGITCGVLGANVIDQEWQSKHILFGSCSEFMVRVLEGEFRRSGYGRSFATAIVPNGSEMIMEKCGDVCRLGKPSFFNGESIFVVLKIWMLISGVRCCQNPNGETLFSYSGSPCNLSLQNIIDEINRDVKSYLRSSVQSASWPPNDYYYADRRDEVGFKSMNPTCLLAPPVKRSESLLIPRVELFVRAALAARFDLIDKVDYLITDDNCLDLRYLPLHHQPLLRNGLHQFLQLKHSLPLEAEAIELAVMTKTSFFRKYNAGLYCMLTGVESNTHSALTSVYNLSFFSFFSSSSYRSMSASASPPVRVKRAFSDRSLEMPQNQAQTKIGETQETIAKQFTTFLREQNCFTDGCFDFFHPTFHRAEYAWTLFLQNSSTTENVIDRFHSEVCQKVRKGKDEHPITMVREAALNLDARGILNTCREALGKDPHCLAAAILKVVYMISNNLKLSSMTQSVKTLLSEIKNAKEICVAMLDRLLAVRTLVDAIYCDQTNEPSNGMYNADLDEQYHRFPFTSTDHTKRMTSFGTIVPQSNTIAGLHILADSIPVRNGADHRKFDIFYVFYKLLKSLHEMETVLFDVMESDWGSEADLNSFFKIQMIIEPFGCTIFEVELFNAGLQGYPKLISPIAPKHRRAWWPLIMKFSTAFIGSFLHAGSQFGTALFATPIGDLSKAVRSIQQTLHRPYKNAFEICHDNCRFADMFAARSAIIVTALATFLRGMSSDTANRRAETNASSSFVKYDSSLLAQSQYSFRRIGSAIAAVANAVYAADSAPSSQISGMSIPVLSPNRNCASWILSNSAPPTINDVLPGAEAHLREWMHFLDIQQHFLLNQENLRDELQERLKPFSIELRSIVNQAQYRPLIALVQLFIASQPDKKMTDWIASIIKAYFHGRAGKEPTQRLKWTGILPAFAKSSEWKVPIRDATNLLELLQSDYLVDFLLNQLSYGMPLDFVLHEELKKDVVEANQFLRGLVNLMNIVAPASRFTTQSIREDLYQYIRSITLLENSTAATTAAAAAAAAAEVISVSQPSANAMEVPPVQFGGKEKMALLGTKFWHVLFAHPPNAVVADNASQETKLYKVVQHLKNTAGFIKSADAAKETVTSILLSAIVDSLQDEVDRRECLRLDRVTLSETRIARTVANENP